MTMNNISAIFLFMFNHLKPLGDVFIVLGFDLRLSGFAMPRSIVGMNSPEFSDFFAHDTRPVI